MRAARRCARNRLEQGKGPNLDLGHTADARRGDNAVAAGREIDEAGGQRHAALVLAVGLEGREQLWRRRETGTAYAEPLDLAGDAGPGRHDDVVRQSPVDLRGGNPDTAAKL